jgi:hypothetical protein
MGRGAARDSLAPAPKRQGEDDAAAKRLRNGLASLQSQLTDPATSRTQAIALVDGLAKELRAADEEQAAWRRVISDCHFSVQLNHFIPGFLSYSVPVF